MKKLTMSLMAACLMLLFLPAQLNAAIKTTSSNVVATNFSETVDPNVLLDRLNEIKSMDKSNMNTTKKKELRKETRSIKKSLKANNGGIYLSVGAIVIIALLLILLL